MVSIRFTGDHRAQRRLLLLFLALNAVLLFAGVQGFDHGRLNNFHDQSIQIPIIYSYSDSALFARDFLLDARDSYVTWFYPLIGYAARVLPLEPLMAALYALTLLLTIGGVYALGTTLFARREVGLVATVLWMAYFPNPGGDFIHGPFVTHTTFSIALELWVLVLFLRRRYAWAALLLGLATNINAMTAFFVAVMGFFAVLADRRQWSWRLLQLPLITGLAALPILIWRFSLPLREASLDEFVEIIRLRLWYAVFPSEMLPLLWLGFFALLALWLVSFRYGQPAAHRQVLAMMLGIGLLCLIGAFFSEVIPLEFVIELQLIRSTWLINLIVLLYFANMVYAQLTSGDRRQAALAFALISVFAVPRLLLEVMPKSQPTPYPLEADLDTLLHDRYPLLIVLVVALGLLGLLWIVWRWLRTQAEAPLSAAQARPVVAWIGVTIALFTLPAFIPSNLPAEQVRTTTELEAVAQWAHDHTALEAYFFVPPTLDGFRVVAKRGHVGNWKDGTVGIFHNGWAIEWRDRMRAMGLNEDAFAFEPMTQDRLCAIAAQYGVDYALVFNAWQIAGEPVYQNETFAVIPAAALICTEQAAAASEG